MALFDSISQFLALNPWREPDPMPGPLQTREVTGASVAGFIARIQGAREIPYRLASTEEALGVPAIFSAVTLISNATGSLSFKAFQAGRELPETDRPRLIVRPNPFGTPRDFFRDTAFSMAVYGEAWWWVAARDFDGLPLSLIPVNPREIQVTEDDKDLRFPIIEWRGRKMRNEDMKQITYLKDPGGLRGFGPLQKCGAAVSVAVEAQEWAANFYAEGGVPSIGIKTAWPLSGDKDLTDEEAQSEADKLRAQWMSKAHNTPRVYGPDIEKIEEFGVNSEGAQMLTARAYNDVNVAQLFNIPAPMLEAAVAGSSLTYQNIPSLFDSFARRCLTPNYLEPIEQTMSDLLTRQTVARFNLDALLRVDIKTRFEVYGLGIDKGIYTPEMAQAKEGIVPGDVEFAPVPASVPAAIPSSLPIQGREAAQVRCQCGNLLAELAAAPYRFTCRKCKRVNEAQAALETHSEAPAAPMEMHLHLPERMAVVENHPPEIRVESPTVHMPEITVHTPDVKVDVGPTTFAEGAFRGGDVRMDAPVTNIHEGALRLVDQTPMVAVIDYDEAGEITGFHEERSA